MKRGTIVIVVPLLAVVGALWLTLAPPAAAQGRPDASPGPEGLYVVTADGGPLGLVNTFIKVDRDGTYIASGFDILGLNEFDFPECIRYSNGYIRENQTRFVTMPNPIV